VKECPNCAVEIRDDARVCPICKYAYGTRSGFPWKPAAVALLIALLVPVILAVVRAVRG
jgi:hypothetical protein